jgi:hypothetical protein
MLGGAAGGLTNGLLTCNGDAGCIGKNTLFGTLGGAGGAVLGKVMSELADEFSPALAKMFGSSPAVGGATEASTGGLRPVLQGQAGVARSIAAAEARGETVLGREITVDTTGARTRPDLLVQDAEGNLKFIESKNGPFASLTPNQEAAFPLLVSEGGVPRGMNAARAGLEPGVPIGPIPVQIDWWSP